MLYLPLLISYTVDDTMLYDAKTSLWLSPLSCLLLVKVSEELLKIYVSSTLFTHLWTF